MRTVGVAVVMALFLTPAAFAQRVSVDWDHDADFTKYKTYKYVKSEPVEDPLMDERVVAALEAQMGEKGFTKDDSNPDMIVTYHANHKENKAYVTDSFGYGGYGAGWRWGGMGMGNSTTRVITSEKGTIVIDMYDAKSKQMLFRGKATDTLSSKPKKNAEKINKAVTKVFKKYPPKS